MTAAATFTGTNYTLQDTPVIGTTPRAAVVGGITYCSLDTVFASDTDLGQGSLLYCGKLPKGAVVQFSIVTPIATTGIATTMTNTVTMTMGYTGDPDALGVVTDLNASAAPQFIRPVPDGTVNTAMSPLSAARDVYLTTIAAQELVAAEGVEVKIFYTVAGQIA